MFSEPSDSTDPGGNSNPGENTAPVENTAPLEPPVVSASLVQADAMQRLIEPKFLHPSSIFFEAASHVRRLLFPALFALYSAASGGRWGAVAAAVVFGTSLISTVFKYFTLRYQIKGTDFVVSEGLIFRRVRSVPIRRIQNVDLIQNVLHRIFDVAEVNIETASGTKPEATLRVLTRRQIDELRAAIFGEEAAENETSGSVSDADPFADGASIAETGLPDTSTVPYSTEQDTVPEKGGHANGDAKTARTIHHVSLRQLCLAGLASNRGLVLLGVVAGLFSQTNWADSWTDGLTDKSAWKRYSPERLRDFLPEQLDSYAYALLIVSGVLLVFLILRLVGVAWYVLRFYDHTVTRRGNDLRINCGLFTRVSASIPRQRIQFISIHRSLIMRWMGLASIRIETAGGGGDENENAASTVSRRWFLPVVAEQDVHRILAELRPGLDWQPDDTEWHGVSPRTRARLLRIAAVFSLAFSIGGFFLWRPWGISVGFVVFALLGYVAVKKSKAMRYAQLNWGVAYRSGLLYRRLSFAFYDRIQTLELHQSLFDARWNMASLRIDTAAAGPAEHVIDVNYLDADFARQQLSALQQETAKQLPSWA